MSDETTSAVEHAGTERVHDEFYSRKEKNLKTINSFHGTLNNLKVNLVSSSQRNDSNDRLFSKALIVLRQSTKLSELMNAIKILERSTKESYPYCKILADERSPEVLYKIIRSCNRSDPHTKLLECLLQTLSNVSTHSNLIASMTNENSVDTLVDVIQLFRDKNEIFCTAVQILKRTVLSNNVFMVSAKRSIF